MATRLYMTSVAPVWRPETFKGAGTAWSDTAGSRTVKLSPVKEGGVVVHGRAETSTSNTWQVCLVRAVSDPLPNSGTLQAQFRFTWARHHSAVAAAMRLVYRIWVTVGDTDAVRGTLSTWAGTTNWPTALTIESFVDNDTPVVVQAGDRIVFEYGYRATNAVATSYTGSTRIGGTAGDLGTSGTTGVSTLSPWVEFADVNDPIFTPPPAGPTYSVLMPDGSTRPAELSGVLMPDGSLRPITTTVQQ